VFGDITTLWREERRTRWFLAAHLQGAIGTAAGYVALLLLAYERIGSAWAATAVMLADLLPAMLLGPLLGGLIDRTSRLGCAIAADLLRAAAFAALVLVDGTAAMIALALLAGTGTALFRPATAALLPSLVPAERLPAANACYGMVREGGQLLGPALAAGMLLIVSPSAVIGLNAGTFALTALLLAGLRGHVRPAAAPATAEAAATGVRGILRDPLVRTLLRTSGSVVLFAGAMNVGELVLAQRDLGAGGTGYALLVGAYGIGLFFGSLLAARAGDPRTRYFTGLALIAAGMLASALAPVTAIALLTFGLTGLGNGLYMVSSRLMLQRAIPEHLHGRGFGLADSIDAWGFGAAAILGGAVATAGGGRVTFALAGAGVLVAGLVAARALQPPGLPVLELGRSPVMGFKY
jgi:MFS family permease